MKHKKLLIAAAAIFTVLVVFATFVIIWYWGDSYGDFKEFRQEIEIPALGEGAVPQGITSCRSAVSSENSNSTQDYFFISAAFDGKPPRIYVIGKNTGYGGYVTLKNVDGSDYTGGTDGIAINTRNLWIASDGKIYTAQSEAYVEAFNENKSTTNTETIVAEIIRKAALRNTLGDDVQLPYTVTETNAEGETTENIITEKDLSVKITSSFNANCNADFLYFYDDTSSSNDDKLYVGESQGAESAKTTAGHGATTPAGDENTAFVYQYDVVTGTYNANSTGLTCIASDNLEQGSGNVPKIEYVYSITGDVRGFARTIDGNLALSHGGGLKNSHVLYYDWTAITKTANRKSYKDVKGTGFEYEGVKTTNKAPYRDNGMYMYFIDSSTLLRTYTVPAKAGNLCFASDRIHVLFSSGAKKYRNLTRQALDNVYSFVPSK